MDQPEFTCRTCPNRDVCQAPCDWMEKQLPTEPTFHLEQTFGLFPSTTLIRAMRPASNGSLRRFRRGLTNREWRALELVYVDGLTQREAAQQLGLTRRGLRDRLQRACRKIARRGKRNRV